MGLLILFGVGFTTGLSGAMLPGPLFLHTVSEALHAGRWTGVKVAVGHLLLELCFVALILLGCRQLLVSSTFRAIMVWVGAIGLIVMGAMILTQLPHFSLRHQAAVAFHGGPWLGGAVFSIVSPGFIVWWATIGAAVLVQGMLAGWRGLAAVLLGHAAADVSWSWGIALSVEKGKAYCTDRTYRLIMAGIAAWLIILGVGLPMSKG
ncbi:MAG: LysE family transporter [Candidatus Omnitrophica bacterium]|nr:LysE family transporter [Candidatus Omnitrophota bacterium]